MKRISLLLGAILLLCLGAATAPAQMRVAFLDASKLIKQMPEASDAESRLQQLVDAWNREAGDLQSELDRKQGEYDRKKLILTDAERGAIEVDLKELRARLDKFRQDKYGTNGDLFTQQANLMKPVYEKLSKAIEEAAAEGKYDYVFDKSSRDFSILYTNAKYDLTAAVAKKLGIETNDIFSVPLDRFNTKDQSTPPNVNTNAPNQSTPPRNPRTTPPDRPGMPQEDVLKPR